MAIYRPSHIHDTITTLIDSIQMEQDLLLRVAAFAYASREFKHRFPPPRDEAAWLARHEYSAFDIAEVAGVGDKDIYNWSMLHSRRTGAPAPPRRSRVDVSSAVRLAVEEGWRSAPPTHLR